MNSVVMVGRLAKDVDLRFTQTGKAVANFSIAVDRQFNKEETDFFNVQVWGKTAESVANYLSKGSQAAIRGRIQNRSYEKDGQKKYITEIIADEVKFLGSKKGQSEEPRFEEVDDEDVPF